MDYLNLPTNPWSDLSGGERQILLNYIVIFTSLWTLLFLVFRFLIFRKRSFDFSNRMVSILHAFIAFALCTISFEDLKHPLRNVGKGNTKKQMQAIVISMSYFVYDLFCCLFEVPIDFVITLHHIFTIFPLIYGLLVGKSGEELIACLWLMELSNPFMHLRELLKEFKLRDTAIALYNDIAFALTFTFARMVVGPFVVYATLFSLSSIPVKIGAVAIQVVSTFWFMKLVRVIRYKLLKKKEKKQ